jgi:hypothetical protein
LGFWQGYGRAAVSGPDRKFAAFECDAERMGTSIDVAWPVRGDEVRWGSPADSTSPRAACVPDRARCTSITGTRSSAPSSVARTPRSVGPELALRPQRRGARPDGLSGRGQRGDSAPRRRGGRVSTQHLSKALMCMRRDVRTESWIGCTQDRGSRPKSLQFDTRTSHNAGSVTSSSGSNATPCESMPRDERQGEE